MRLYKNSNGVWAGTQADARKYCGKDYQTVDVPTDKPSLLMFLNANKVGSGGDEIKPVEPVEGATLTEDALSYFRWAYDKFTVGHYEIGKELMKKALEMSRKEKTDGD